MDGKNYTRITKEVCGSLWFARFARGCNRRMGQDWRPDQAISVDLEIALLEYVEIKLQTTFPSKHLRPGRCLRPVRCEPFFQAGEGV